MAVVRRCIIGLLLLAIGRIFFASASLLFAETETTFPTQHDFEWSIGRDPEAAYRWVEGQYQAMNASTPDERRIRISNFLMMASLQLESMELVTRDLDSIKKAWDLARQLHLYEDRLSIGLNLGMLYNNINRPQQAELTFKSTIAEARVFNNPAFLMQCLTNYGQILTYISRSPEAMPYFQEAQSLANDQTLDIDPMLRHVTRITAALAVEGEDYKSVYDIFDNSLRYFQDHNLLSYVTIFSFNAASSYKLKKTSDLTKSRYFYQMALDSARILKDRSTEGAALSELASIENSENNFAEARKKALEAIAVIGKSDNRWLGRAFSEKARSELASQAYNVALEDVLKALQLIPEEFIDHQSLLYQLKGQILEKLGQWPAAIEALRKHYHLERQASTGREETSFANARVQLGLQMEEQRSTILQKENELQAAKIQANKRLILAIWALGVLLVSALGFLIWALYNARRITQAQARIQNILDVIEEGILTIDSKLALEPFHSPHLKKLYPELSQQKGDAVDLLFPPEAIGSEMHSMIRETLRAILGEEMLAWELNEAHLPDEIQLSGDAPLTVHILWQPLLDTDQRIRSVLLSLRDISEQKQLEQAIEDQIKIAATNQERMQELLLTRLPDANRLLDALELILITREEPTIMLRKLHTAKGEARTLGLKQLSACIHQLESQIQSASNQDDWSPLRREINAYMQLIQDVFGTQQNIAKSVQSLTEVLAGLLPGLKSQLQGARQPLGSFEIIERIESWPGPVLEAARQSLLHALTNSADHGYILPQEKSRARFLIEADEDQAAIHVVLRDFGAGLDRQKLEQLARQRGFVPSDKSHWADVVFMDGASTAEQTTSTSGRGVGLSVVRGLCQELGGDAHLYPNDQGTGTMLVMQFAKTQNF